MQNTPQVSGALSIRRQLEFYSRPQQKAKPKNKTENAEKTAAEGGIFSARHAIPNRPLKRDALFSNCGTNYEIRGDSSQLTRTERLLGGFFSAGFSFVSVWNFRFPNRRRGIAGIYGFLIGYILGKSSRFILRIALGQRNKRNMYKLIDNGAVMEFMAFTDALGGF